MTEDPIIAEVRAARAKLMAECDDDLNKLCERIRQMQAQHPDRLVNRIQLDERRKRRPWCKKAHG